MCLRFWMLNIYWSPRELVIAFHIHTSHKCAKTSRSELSRSRRWGGTSTGRQWDQPLSPPYFCCRSLCSFFKAAATRIDSDSLGLGLGKHRSPEAAEGQKLSPSSVLACFKVLQNNPKSRPTPGHSQASQGPDACSVFTQHRWEQQEEHVGKRNKFPLPFGSSEILSPVSWGIYVFHKNSI